MAWAMKELLRKCFVIALISSLILFPQGLSGAAEPQDAAPPAEEPSAAAELAYGVLSVFATMVYTPLKITYAGLGLITGGLAYALTLGGADVAQIIDPAVRGTYVLTPRHIQGAEPILFIGPPPATDPQPQGPSSPPPPSPS